MSTTFYALICTRSKNLSDTTQKLVSYLSRGNIEVKLIVGSKSIFEGYSTTVKKINPSPDDIIILCHDDIEILSSLDNFKKVLIKELKNKKRGFVGVAGTTKLSNSAVWWEHSLWKQQFHRGVVLHGSDITNGVPSYYGEFSQTVVMDGLFLAATGRTINKVSLEQPQYLPENWDFYDIHYTYTAHSLGLENKAVPIFILHNSRGEVENKHSWHKNREAFINKNIKNFPITC